MTLSNSFKYISGDRNRQNSHPFLFSPLERSYRKRLKPLKRLVLSVKSGAALWNDLFLFTLSLICLMFLFNCAPSYNYLRDTPEVIEEMVQKKLNAIEDSDQDLYLSLIDKNNSEFYWEQYRWFHSYRRSDVQNYRIRILGVEQKEDDAFLVTLKQTYGFGDKGERSSITYDEIYVKSGDRYFDSGRAFNVHETEHFIIKYDKRLHRHITFIERQAERAYQSATKAIGLEPETRTTIKMYYGRKEIDESIGVARFFPTGGWHGSGESLKISVRKRNRMRYDWVIAHELIHKITFEVSHSICRWFSEGIAKVYGDMPLLKLEMVRGDKIDKAQLSKPMSWLEENSPLKMKDTKEIRIYYAMSLSVVRFILETFGEDSVKKILDEYSNREALKEKSKYHIELDDEIDIFYQIMEKLFDVSKTSFNAQWLEWIKND